MAAIALEEKSSHSVTRKNPACCAMASGVWNGSSHAKAIENGIDRRARLDIDVGASQRPRYRRGRSPAIAETPVRTDVTIKDRHARSRGDERPLLLLPTREFVRVVLEHSDW